MSDIANSRPILAAWLHIGPEVQSEDESTPLIGVQRLLVAEVSEGLRENCVALSFLPSHLASDAAMAVYHIAGDAFDYMRAVGAIRDGVAEHGNIEFAIGTGMLATVCPAEPTSGVNLSRTDPVRITV